MSLRRLDFADDLQAIFGPVSSDTAEPNALRLILAGAVTFSFGEDSPLTIQEQDLEMLSDSVRALNKQDVIFPKKPKVKVANLRYGQDVLALPREEKFDIIVCCNLLVAEGHECNQASFSLHMGDAQSNKMFEPMSWTNTFNNGNGRYLCLLNDYSKDHENFIDIIDIRNKGFVQIFSGVTAAHEFSGCSRYMTIYDFIPR